MEQYKKFINFIRNDKRRDFFVSLFVCLLFFSAVFFIPRITQACCLEYNDESNGCILSQRCECCYDRCCKCSPPVGEGMGKKTCKGTGISRPPQESQPPPAGACVGGAAQVPQMLQGDPAYGSTPYGGGVMSNWGCVPTSMAMILAYMGRPADPLSVAAVCATTPGAIVTEGEHTGTISDVCGPAVAGQLGLSYRSDATWEEIIRDLANCTPVGFGVTSYGGHEIVLTGISADGQTVYINDPLSGQTTMSKDSLLGIWDGGAADVFQ